MEQRSGLKVRLQSAPDVVTKSQWLVVVVATRENHQTHFQRLPYKICGRSPEMRNHKPTMKEQDGHKNHKMVLQQTFS